MKVSSSGIKLGFAVISSSCLATVAIAFSSASAIAAQFITIESSGTLSGTIELPRNNPNFNNSITRIDTDEAGTYYRNLGTNNNPNYVPVYQSDYLKVQTRSDGSLHYFVDFKGIPIVSFDGVLTSPVLSGGQLTPYKYQGQLAGTTFQGVVQDEFNLTKAFYTGTVTDPDTGKQYQGTFEVSGYGQRYSNPNGSLTPTVFDFQSDIPGLPTITSLTITNATLANLRIKVPIDETSIPEPASLVGILMVAGCGILLKRRKDIEPKKMF
ncbi:PEP-CTERM sorting domain-containing protein [Nostoc sp. NMS8]|uniref:PEP-CTERM sorting domain-containing protein n=1 Tax=Nostoc sp. NMS8 TaxID=2815392 RepID=UPI0025CC2323|nr:PEP-CTERM sorting domain-containing protein [Nostoc sp. NMS8]MBN3959412.1 PEP-CTERM sorting domain-containing protein [Nostoc sp. NMS8]